MSGAQANWPQPLAGINWQQAWLTPYARLGRLLAQGVLRGEPVWQVLHALRDAGEVCAQLLHQSPRQASPGFVAQSALPHGQAYEAYIYQTRTVPTRCGAHDFFNGLMWLNWPHTKATLNQRQWQALEAAGGVGQTRGPTRDALTLLDENGAVLLAPPAIWDALRHRQWQMAFVTLRPLWAQCQLLVVGHALLEQLLLYPRKSLTAHVWLPTPSVQALFGKQSAISGIDHALAQALRDDDLSQKPFTPLPVMGTPNWCDDNAHPSFYDDPQVFRPLRLGQNPPQRVAALTDR